MSCRCEMKQQAKESKLAAHGYEVGWSYVGHPTPDEKYAALSEMLARHGTDPEAWILTPRVRYAHNDQAQVRPLEIGLVVPTECFWAVYGILATKPEVGHVPEGVRLPTYDKREYTDE